MVFGKRDDDDITVWTARVLGIAIILLLTLFVFGEKGMTLDLTEWTGLAFFPLGIVTGFLISWRNDLIGGLVSVASLACFYLVFGLALTGRLPGADGSPYLRSLVFCFLHMAF